MGKLLGDSRDVKARKPHGCFLCCLAIPAGSVYKTWTWLDETPQTVRVHLACNSYAHDRIEDWTNGDGVDESAVETDLMENLRRWAPDGWGRTIGVNEDEAARVLAAHPDLAALVARVRAEIMRDVRPSGGDCGGEG